MIIIKDDSVRLRKITPALAFMFHKLSLLNERKIPDYPVDFVITSINDGKHLANSKHYKDEAIDLRSKNFKSLEVKQHFKKLLEIELGTKFTVLLENVNAINEHYHIQVKKGEVFP